MKNPLRVLLALLCGLLATALPAATSADAAFAEFQSVVASKLPADTPHALASLRWNWDKKTRINELGWRFLADHPADPRRWDVALVLLAQSPEVLKSLDEAALAKLKPTQIQPSAMVFDPEATAQARARLAELEAKCAAATDMTPATRRNYLFRKTQNAVGKFQRSLLGGVNISLATGAVEKVSTPEDVAAMRVEIRAVVEELIANYPDDDETGKIFTSYAAMFRRSDPPAYKALLQEHVESPSGSVSAAARDGLVLLAAEGRPLDWKFTAADGREVDFEKLRGKVVLIDFWATWCGPCVKEIPSILAAYRKYHDQGFEVVGITLELTDAKPGDTPEQATARLAAAKARLLEFVAKENLPWPQYFDGTGRKNPYTARYGIQSIPAMFLVDQSGMVVSMDARGAKLEPALRRLLKLPAAKPSPQSPP
jgi:thiol-disulfide isomerase/thioredoxin